MIPKPRNPSFAKRSLLYTEAMILAFYQDAMAALLARRRRISKSEGWNVVEGIFDRSSSRSTTWLRIMVRSCSMEMPSSSARTRNAFSEATQWMRATRWSASRARSSICPKMMPEAPVSATVRFRVEDDWASEGTRKLYEYGGGVGFGVSETEPYCCHAS